MIEANMDRKKYLRKIRNKMLKKIGLPKDTPPEAFQIVLEERRVAKRDAPSTEEDRKEYLRRVRAQLLKNLGLPEDTPPDKASDILGRKK